MLCRDQTLFTIEKQTGKNKAKRIIIVWTTGLKSLPNEGGMLDQPYRMMEYFRQFITGDRFAANKRLESTS